MSGTDLTQRTRETKFVLVYEELRHGGIETMIYRLAKAIHRHGARAAIVCKAGGDLEPMVVPYADIHHHRSARDLRRIAAGLNHATRESERVCIISFDTGSSTRATYLAQFLAGRGEVRNLTGVFHPQAYFMPGQPADRLALNRLILSLFSAQSTFFMNAECKRSHSDRFGIDYTASPVIILPVIDAEGPIYVHAPRALASPNINILSVGRIVPFKAYNRGAPAIAAALRGKGVSVRWDIYGDGPDEAEVEARAIDLGVEAAVQLRGQLAYGALPSIIDKYDVFVGMGTAALEAAALGLPTICAIIDAENASYGYVHELPLGNVGEVIGDAVARPIAEILETFARSDPAARLNLSRRSLDYCESYGVDTFLASILDMSASAPAEPRSFWRRLISRTVFEVTEGHALRTLLNRGFKTRLLRSLRLRPGMS